MQLCEGFEMADIPEIANMLDGIAIIDACISRYWDEEFVPRPVGNGRHYMAN